MAVTLELSYFNTFWLKRLKNFTQYQERQADGTVDVESGGTTVGTPDVTTGAGYIDTNVYEDWFVEESRIEGGFNNTTVDFGNKAYIVEEEEKQIRRKNALIYSGIYNAKNGINNSNQFPIGEDITRSVDPSSGSIQKLYAENTNLLILQERKVNRAPIDKDVIFTQEGQPVTANSTKVIGTPSAFEGNFGISRDPGSFAVYGYNKYFTDKDRSVVMQLGPNGLNPISNYGMIDYFRDKLNIGGEITGGYDVFNKNYVLTINETSGAATTVVFDDLINGWVSFMEYTPQLMTSSQGEYYTFKNNGIWQHYVGPEYNLFYGKKVQSSVQFIFNPDPTRTKTFKTLSYTGSNGWSATTLTNEYTGIDNNPQQPALGETSYTDSGQTILSYDDGYYVSGSTQYRAGFNRKQNVYYAAIKDLSPARPQQVVIGNIDAGGTVVGSGTTGIKGQYLNVIFTQSVSTGRNPVQLFSVGAEYNNR
jgi:hypothetical protein